MPVPVGGGRGRRKGVRRLLTWPPPGARGWIKTATSSPAQRSAAARPSRGEFVPPPVQRRLLTVRPPPKPTRHRPARRRHRRRRRRPARVRLGSPAGRRAARRGRRRHRRGRGRAAPGRARGAVADVGLPHRRRGGREAAAAVPRPHAPAEPVRGARAGDDGGAAAGAAAHALPGRHVRGVVPRLRRAEGHVALHHDVHQRADVPAGPAQPAAAAGRHRLPALVLVAALRQPAGDQPAAHHHGPHHGPGPGQGRGPAPDEPLAHGALPAQHVPGPAGGARGAHGPRAARLGRRLLHHQQHLVQHQHADGPAVLGAGRRRVPPVRGREPRRPAQPGLPPGQAGAPAVHHRPHLQRPEGGRPGRGPPLPLQPVHPPVRGGPAEVLGPAARGAAERQ